MLEDQLTLGIIVGAALLDSINPCVFGVLIFLIAFLTRVLKKPHLMLIGGLLYSAVVYVTYLVLGLGVIKFSGSLGLSSAVYWVAAVIAILAGLLEIKDFFWYGKGPSLQMIPGAAKRLKMFTVKIEQLQSSHPYALLPLVALLGVFVVLVELPCTGAPYFAVLALLAEGDYGTALPYLLLYNFIFVLPLLVVVAIAYFGTSVEALEKWRMKNRKGMRLVVGVFLIGLGAFMIKSIL